jgi:hypothetical protein
MPRSRYKAVFEYTRRHYPCGLKAGDKLRVSSEIVVCDHRNRPTGHIHPVGEIWEVLPGVESEPGVIWLRDSSGERQTWDETIFDTFEKIKE